MARVEGVLHCGVHGLKELAERHGTPLYVYSGERILERLAALRTAFSQSPPLVAYSVKANPNLSLLRLLARAGAGADIVSGGELFRALQAGVPSDRIVFAGVGKSEKELRLGLEAGIKAFHVESAQELEALGRVAERLGVVAPFGVRLNPDVASPTHEYTRTGHAAAKFGVAADEAVDLYRRGAAHGHLHPTGIDLHIGSQIHEIEPFLLALDGALTLVDRVEAETGLALDHLDLGGGFGISDGQSGGLDVGALGAAVGERLASRTLELILEPGRFVVGDAGVLITRVVYVKRGGGKTFVVTDAGMTDLIRPSHYGGLHPISFVDAADEGPVERVDVVGPVCETGDFLARDRDLPLPTSGSLLCVHAAGAYGFTMASNYNSRPRPAEVLVSGNQVLLIRQRETFEDLVRGEILA